MESPFIIKKRQKRSSKRPCKKPKSNKSTSVTPLVLMKGDLDEIGDMVHDATENIWGHIEEQYHQMLDEVQQGLRELQVQTCIIQASVGQETLKYVSLK